MTPPFFLWLLLSVLKCVNDFIVISASLIFSVRCDSVMERIITFSVDAISDSNCIFPLYLYVERPAILSVIILCGALLVAPDVAGTTALGACSTAMGLFSASGLCLVVLVAFAASV